MSELTNLIDSIKNGELSVVAQKLTAMQTEISNALTLINNLKLEVQGSSTDTTNPVGTIHSPARLDSLNNTKEMFIGNYLVGDILAGTGLKTGIFRFGAGSACYFNFMPSDPLHGVNKKYVDQVLSPINNQLTNMINRTGDMVPNNTLSSIGKATYIYDNFDSSNVVKWLLDDGIRGSEFAGFDALASSVSAFFLNVTDGRYYGEQGNPFSIMTLQACNAGYISRTTNTGVNATFDAGCRLEWADTRAATTKLATEPNALATMQNVSDLMPAASYYNANNATIDYEVGGASYAHNGWIVIGGNGSTIPHLIIYTCITNPIAIPVVGYTAPSGSGANSSNPEFDIPIPAGLFSNIMSMNATLTNNSNDATGQNNDDDVFLQIIPAGSSLSNVRIKYQGTAGMGTTEATEAIYTQLTIIGIQSGALPSYSL
jgi:hypothetical protein